MPKSLTRLMAGTLVVPLMAAAACKDEPTVVTKADGTTRVETAGGVTIVDSAREGGSLEMDTPLPAYAPAYPGAKLKTQLSNGRSGPGGRLMVFETADSIADVAAFYDARAGEAGVKPDVIVNEDDSAVRIFGGPNRSGRAMGTLIAISRSDEGTGTEIVITAGMAPDEMARMEKDEGWRDRTRPAVRLQ